tara:strand:+ start:1221 stop:1415 length:195 start_codon:yes stop_codon:yes gene_type:complete
MFADDFNPDGVRASPAERKRRLAKQQKWKRAADRRSGWTRSQFEEEEKRLEEEKQAFLAARKAA